MSHMVRIRLMGLAGGGAHPMNWQYLVQYDPDLHEENGDYNGGLLVCTHDPEEATWFTVEEAFHLWQSAPSCKCHRLRPDGELNKPLTAFNVAFQ